MRSDAKFKRENRRTKIVHDILNTKRVAKIGSRSHAAKTAAKRTAKLTAFVLAAATVATGLNTNSTFAKYVLADPPTYPSNEQLEFIITRIVPSTSTVEATFERLPERNWHNIYKFNLAFGTVPSDYALNQMGFGLLDGDTRIYGGNSTSLGAWEEGQATVVSATFVRNGGSIANNTSGKMHFVALYSDMSRDFGRVDYSRCINSSVFQSGEATECRAEKLGNGKIQYQPYTSDGVRVEIPADEDELLTALTNRYVYESGDWPAEYVWVDDEPENNPNPGDNPGGNSGDNTGDNTGDNSGNGSNDDSDGNNSESGNSDNNTSGNNNSENTSVDEGNTNNDNTTSDATIEIIIATSDSSANGAAGTNSNSNADASTTSYSGAWGSLANATAQTTNGATESDSTNTATSDKSTSEKSASDTTSGSDANTSDDIEVPDLGKEPATNQVSWVIPVLIALSAAAALASWWFLFFGKRKSNKERKE